MIPHFILCLANGYLYAESIYERQFQNMFLSKMRRSGIKSAILTILDFWREDLKTKEAVKQQHLEARKTEEDVFVERMISEDLESFYTSLQNPECQLIEEYVEIFSTKKLTEEELTLLENRNREYLSKYISYSAEFPPHFDRDMKRIKNSSDPESIFCNCVGYRKTITLHATFKSVQAEIRKRFPNEDLSDIETIGGKHLCNCAEF